LSEILRQYVRDIVDFPKPGVIFKDISPILESPQAMKVLIQELIEKINHIKFDGLVGIESRGFLFGPLLAHHFNVPFYMVRKKGKLPAAIVSKQYELEYGIAELEVHTDSIKKGMKILIHDDLLATGGSANACTHLLHQLKAKISGYLFLIELDHLNGRKVLAKCSNNIHSILHY
jgi:adenine phosphoribosyltransferase